MTTKTIVCADCGAAVPYGRLSCPACGALLASVAGGPRRRSRIADAPASGRRAAVADGRAGARPGRRRTAARARPTPRRRSPRRAADAGPTCRPARRRRPTRRSTPVTSTTRRRRRPPAAARPAADVGRRRGGGRTAARGRVARAGAAAAAPTEAPARAAACRPRSTPARAGPAPRPTSARRRAPAAPVGRDAGADASRPRPPVAAGPARRARRRRPRIGRGRAGDVDADASTRAGDAASAPDRRRARLARSGLGWFVVVGARWRSLGFLLPWSRRRHRRARASATSTAGGWPARPTSSSFVGLLAVLAPRRSSRDAGAAVAPVGRAGPRARWPARRARLAVPGRPARADVGVIVVALGGLVAGRSAASLAHVGDRHAEAEPAV